MHRSRNRAGHGVLVMLVALAGISVGAARAAQEDREGAVLSAMSQKPLMMLRVNGLAGLRDECAQTRLAERLGKSPALAAVADFGRSWLRFGAGILADLPESTLERLLGRETVLAVYPPSDPAAGRLDVALAAHLGADADLVKQAFDQRVLPRLMAWNERLVATPEEIDGFPVTRLSDGPKKVYVRFADALFMLGHKDALMRFIPASAQIPQWVGRRDLPEGVAFAFLDLEPLWERGLSQANRGDAQGLRFTGFPAVRDIRASTAVQDGGFKDVLVFSMQAEPTGLLPAAMKLSPGSSRCAGVIPQGYAFALSLQIESGEKLHALVEDTIRRDLGEAVLEQFRRGMDMIDQMLTVNLQWEFLPAVGRRVFFAARVPDVDDLASGVRLNWDDFAPIFGFELKDAEGLRSMVERLGASPQAAQRGWQIIHDSYREKEFYTLNHTANPFQLSFALVGDSLVCSRSDDLIRDVIGAVADGRTLTDDPQYQAVREHLPAQANVHVYLNARPVREAVMAVLAARMPPRRRPFLTVLEQAVPDLEGYGLVVGGGEAELRAEAYGDLPVAFLLFSLMTLGIITS